MGAASSGRHQGERVVGARGGTLRHASRPLLAGCAGFILICCSDTPRGLKPHGFSGYACGAPLRSRLKAVSPPSTAAWSGEQVLMERYKRLFSHTREETAMRRQ